MALRGCLLLLTLAAAAAAAAYASDSPSNDDWLSGEGVLRGGRRSNGGPLYSGAGEGGVNAVTPEDVYDAWREVRARLIAPTLQVVLWVCIVMSVMLMMEAVYMSVTSLAVKFSGWKPQKHYKWKPIAGDEEKGSAAYPYMLIQIPMFNELEVYKVAIGASCELDWPKDRLIIQVLDDSTDPLIRKLVDAECQSWASKGIDIHYITRTERRGFKAGALKNGLEFSNVQDCEYVVIFDADFQPEPDFLHQTVPYLVNNPRVALVQARWDFVNHKDSLITRIQKMSMDYHFKVEQEASSAAFAFFSFNGTAGIWRISAIRDAGGWKERTTVEDMDLAVRVGLKGWKFVYVGDIMVRSELPTTYKAYCRQQHRWACGAANLFRKMAREVIIAKDISCLKKFFILYSFFLVRRVVAPLVGFFLYCVILPVSVMVPELYLPVWGVAYIPTMLLIVTAIRHPKSLHLLPVWILFEGVMTMHRMTAALTGLFETSNSNQWIVTKKDGHNFNFKDNPQVRLLEKARMKLKEKVNIQEISLSMFLSFCATYDLLFCRNENSYFINLYLQALAFFLLGFNYVGPCLWCP